MPNHGIVLVRLHLGFFSFLCRLSPATTCPASWPPRTSAYGRTCCPTSVIPATSPGTTPASSRRRATAAGTEAWPPVIKPPSMPLTPEHKHPLTETRCRLPNSVPSLVTFRVLQDCSSSPAWVMSPFLKEKKRANLLQCLFVALLIENNTPHPPFICTACPVAPFSLYYKLRPLHQVDIGDKDRKGQ